MGAHWCITCQDQGYVERKMVGFSRSFREACSKEDCRAAALYRDDPLSKETKAYYRDIIQPSGSSDPDAPRRWHYSAIKMQELIEAIQKKKIDDAFFAGLAERCHNSGVVEVRPGVELRKSLYDGGVYGLTPNPWGDPPRIAIDPPIWEGARYRK